MLGELLNWTLVGDCVHIKGVLLQKFGEPNNQNHVYTRDVWEPHLLPNSLFMIWVRSYTVAGRVYDANNNSISDLVSSCILLTDIYIKDNSLYGNFSTIPNYMGVVIARMIMDGYVLRVNLLSLGCIKEENGVFYVQKDGFKPMRWDVELTDKLVGEKL